MPTRTAARKKPAAKRAGRSRPKDIIAMLKQDHAEVRAMFRRLSGLGPRAMKTRQRIVDNLVRELSIHAAAEEQVLYPNVRRVRRGDSMANHSIDEHQQVKELLTRIMKTKDPDGLDPLLRDLKRAVTEHVKEEEGEIFPALRREASRDQLVQLGRLLGAAKKVAPTRPHPKAPNTPPGNIILGPAAAIADRARDAAKSVTR